MIEMIEYVLMDYDGEAVSIENGEMLWWYPDKDEHWNPDTLKFEPNDDDDDEDKDYGDEPPARICDYWWDSHPEAHDYFLM